MGFLALFTKPMCALVYVRAVKKVFNVLPITTGQMQGKYHSEILRSVCILIRSGKSF